LSTPRRIDERGVAASGDDIDRSRVGATHFHPLGEVQRNGVLSGYGCCQRVALYGQDVDVRVGEGPRVGADTAAQVCHPSGGQLEKPA
jgi:hypothetical protein